MIIGFKQKFDDNTPTNFKEEAQKILRNIFLKQRANHHLRDQPDHPLYELVGLMQRVAKDEKQKKDMFAPAKMKKK